MIEPAVQAYVDACRALDDLTDDATDEEIDAIVDRADRLWLALSPEQRELAKTLLE